MFPLLAALPFVGPLIGKANRVLVETVLFGLVALASVGAVAWGVAEVYSAGKAAEQGATRAAIVRAEGAEATARANADAAKAAQSRTEDLARQVDELARQSEADRVHFEALRRRTAASPGGKISPRLQSFFRDFTPPSPPRRP